MGNRANVGFQHRSVTKSKRIIRWFEGIWAMLKMKLDDNGERTWRKMFFHYIPDRGF